MAAQSSVAKTLPQSGVLVVWLNCSHAVYRHLSTCSVVTYLKVCANTTTVCVKYTYKIDITMCKIHTQNTHYYV